VVAKHLAAVPGNRPRILKIAPDLLALLDPNLTTTNPARAAALETLGLLAVPFVGDDERFPQVHTLARCSLRGPRVSRVSNTHPITDFLVTVFQL